MVSCELPLLHENDAVCVYDGKQTAVVLEKIALWSLEVIIPRLTQAKKEQVTNPRMEGATGH